MGRGMWDEGREVQADLFTCSFLLYTQFFRLQ